MIRFDIEQHKRFIEWLERNPAKMHFQYKNENENENAEREAPLCDYAYAHWLQLDVRDEKIDDICRECPLCIVGKPGFVEYNDLNNMQCVSTYKYCILRDIDNATGERRKELIEQLRNAKIREAVTI